MLGPSAEMHPGYSISQTRIMPGVMHHHPTKQELSVCVMSAFLYWLSLQSPATNALSYAQLPEMQRLLVRHFSLRSSPPESLGVMEADLSDASGGAGADKDGVALGVTETGGGVGMPEEAAFSKSSTCREAGRLLLPPVRPLIC